MILAHIYASKTMYIMICLTMQNNIIIEKTSEIAWLMLPNASILWVFFLSSTWHWLNMNMMANNLFGRIIKGFRLIYIVNTCSSPNSYQSLMSCRYNLVFHEISWSTTLFPHKHKESRYDCAIFNTSGLNLYFES